jgi:hypothetical protein
MEHSLGAEGVDASVRAGAALARSLHGAPLNAISAAPSDWDYLPRSSVLEAARRDPNHGEAYLRLVVTTAGHRPYFF